VPTVTCRSTTNSRRPAPTGAHAAVGLTLLALLVSACSIHVTKNGISGNIAGHKFAASAHSLPAGFPTDVPLPSRSRVIGGAGFSDSRGSGYDAVFAVRGTVTTGLKDYESEFRAAGYKITESSMAPPPATTGTNSPSTTLTVTGGAFQAANSNWNVVVLAGSRSTAASSKVRNGEFGLNLTVTPPASTPTT
jgi:hypothetical protein